MSYAHDLIETAKRALGWPAPTEEEMPLLLMYALLARTLGEEATAENVHDAWALWMAGIRKRDDHPSLVVFGELAPEVQALDEPYVEAVREIARQGG